MIYQTVTLDVSDLELIGVMVMSTETEQDKKFEAMQKSMDLMAEELSVLREKELIKKEKKLAFKGEDYVMTERHLFAKLPMLAVKHPYAHYALMFLIHKMSKTNAVFISQKGLAQLMGCSLSTSKRSIKFLTEHNYIKIGKVGVQNFYQLNANIVWRSSRAMKQKVAIFEATIIALEDEQDPNYMKRWNVPVQYPARINEEYLQGVLDFDVDEALGMPTTVEGEIVED